MISLRSTRGARILKRCFPQGRSERITAAFALQNGAARTSGSSTATIGSWTSIPACRAVAVSGLRNDDFREATSSATSVALHQRRCLSGSSGGGDRGRRPTDERQGNTSDGAKDGEEKATYTFLGQDDLGQLSSESKGEPKAETAENKMQAKGKGDEEDAEALKITWKNARATMKLLWKRYGLVWLGTYSVLYVGMLGGLYVIFDTGLVASEVDTSAAIKTVADVFGAEDNPTVVWLQNTIQTNPKANTFVKALIVNELLEYPRDIVAFAATPSIARALGRAPPKS